MIDLMRVRAVAWKETLDAVRDRRSMMAVALYVVMGPAMIWLSFTGVAEQEAKADQLEIAVAGSGALDGLPGLENAFAVAGMSLKPVDDPMAAVTRGDELIALTVEPDAADRLVAGKPVTVTMILDQSEGAASSAQRRVQPIIASWAQELTTLRLIARGVSPSIAQPLQPEVVDVSSSAERSALILSAFQVFLLIAAFVGAMNVVIDMVPGERERHSLEILLAQPVSAMGLMLGKWVVATVFGLVCAVLTVAALSQFVPRLPLVEFGITSVPDTPGYVALALVAAALAPFAAAFQMMAASFARTFKEAQTYLSFCLIVPMFVAMGIQILQPDLGPAAKMIPMIGHQQLMDDILREQWPTAVEYAAGIGPTLLLTLLCLWGAARLHQRERILQTS